MAQALVLVAVGAIVALALALVWQLWALMPSSWRGARIGKIIYLSLGSLGGWLVVWLGAALTLALLPGREPRWFINTLNALLIGSLLVILGAANTAVWRWRRDIRRGGVRPPLPPGGNPDDD